MTDVGEYTDTDFAEIYKELSKADIQAAAIESKLDEFHSNLDAVIADQRRDMSSAKATPKPTHHQ